MSWERYSVHYFSQQDTAISASVAATLGALTLSATGSVVVSAALSKTLDAVTLSAAGINGLTGTLSATLGSVLSSATATVTVKARVAGSATTRWRYSVLLPTSKRSNGSSGKLLGNVTSAIHGDSGAAANASATITLGDLLAVSAGSIIVSASLLGTLDAVQATAPSFGLSPDRIVLNAQRRRRLAARY